MKVHTGNTNWTQGVINNNKKEVMKVRDIECIGGYDQYTVNKI